MATETDKVNTGALGTLVAVGVFSTLAVALGVDALVRYETSQISAERASHASERYRGLAAEQTAKLLAPPSAADSAKGLVTITDAMTNVAAELAKDPTTASPPPPASADPDANRFYEQSNDKVVDEFPPSPAPVKTAQAAPKTAAPSPAGSVSPKPPTVLAVPPAPPAAPPRAPAPTAPAPTDG